MVADETSGATHDGHHLVERPLLDEVLASRDSQGDLNRGERPNGFSRNGRLDLSLAGNLDQDDIPQCQPLRHELDRHHSKGYVRHIYIGDTSSTLMDPASDERTDQHPLPIIDAGTSSPLNVKFVRLLNRASPPGLLLES